MKTLRVCAVTAIGFAGMTAGAEAQRPTFSSRMEAVRVDVGVTERNRPVAGLTAADFEIFDNGVRQEVALVATDELPLDVVLALDMSGSVEGDRLDDLRAASSAALAHLRPRDRAALITFNQRVSLPVALTSDVAAMRAALEETSEGSTSMIDAAYAALAHADAGSGRALVIVLSDGVDTSSWLTAPSVIDTAKRLDVVLFGISAGQVRGANALEDLADASGGDLIRIESTKQMSAALGSLLEAFRQRYLLSFVPTGVTRGGWHTLEVRAKRRGMSVKARSGYFGS